MRAQRWRDTAGGELDVELDVDLILVQTPEVQLRLAPSHVYVHGELLGVFEDGDKALMLVVSRSRARWRPRRNMLMSEMALNGEKMLWQILWQLCPYLQGKIAHYYFFRYNISRVYPI